MQTTETLFETFKNVLALSNKNNDPSISSERIAEIRKELDSRILPETPLAELGLDSMTMTWIIVKLEEELDVDASGISIFEIFDVQGLMDELIQLRD